MSNFNYFEDYVINILNSIQCTSRTLEENSENIDLYKVSSKTEKYIITVLINGKSVQMEVDSGAKHSILPEDVFLNLQLCVVLQPSNISFRTFSNNVVSCLGRTIVTVVYKKESVQA